MQGQNSESFRYGSSLQQVSAVLQSQESAIPQQKISLDLDEFPLVNRTSIQSPDLLKFQSLEDWNPSIPNQTPFQNHKETMTDQPISPTYKTLNEQLRKELQKSNKLQKQTEENQKQLFKQIQVFQRRENRHFNFLRELYQSLGEISGNPVPATNDEIEELLKSQVEILKSKLLRFKHRNTLARNNLPKARRQASAKPIRHGFTRSDLFQLDEDLTSRTQDKADSQISTPSRPRFIKKKQ